MKTDDTIMRPLNKKINKGNDHSIGLLAIIVYFISPLLSLPIIFLSLFKKDRLGLIALALFGAILSYVIKPTRDLDLARYFELYNLMLLHGSNGLDYVLKESNDYLFFYIYYFFSLFNTPFQFVLFIISFFGFYSCLFVFYKIFKGFRIKNTDYILYILLFVLSFPILSQISVTRFSIGFTFFIWFFYFWYIGKKKYYILFLILACLTHFAYVVYVPIIVLFLFIKNRLVVNFILIILILLALYFSLTGSITTYLAYLPIISEKALTYSDIYAETKVPILSYSHIASVIIPTIFYFMYNKYFHIKLAQIFVVVLMVTLITLSFNIIIYDRYVQIFKPISLIVIVYACVQNNVAFAKNLRMKLITCSLFVPYLLYYLYTFIGIYYRNFDGFFSLGKFFLLGLLGSSYSSEDIIK